MNERRKIVIQMGSDADDSLSTPHFDAEATLTARPVVPLPEGAAGQAYYPRKVGAAKSWSPLFLVLIVLGAISIGVATGLLIGFYKSRQASAPTVNTESPAPDVNAGRTVEVPAQTPTPAPQQQEEEARASVPEAAEEPSVQPKDEKPERAAEDRGGDKEATPPAVPDNRRERDTEITEDDEEEARRAERQRRREERREERRERRRRERELELPAEFPRDIERAGREGANRIRDIFEGRQP